MPTDPKFVLGIIAGEGSFSSSISIDHSRRLNVQPQLQFSVAMEDTETLELIQESVGFGKVYHRADGCSSWKCESEEDRNKIIEFIDEHAGEGFNSTRKYKQFNKWKKTNKYYHKNISGSAKSKEHMKEFVRLARSVNEGVGYSGNSVDDIIAEVDDGSLEQCICGSTETVDGTKCEQLVQSADETCYNH